MRRFLVLAVLSLAVSSLPKMVTAAGAPKGEMHELRKRQKKQRKTFAEQQRAMKNVMKQHPMSPEQHRRFRHDMKMQRQLLRRDQKAGIQNLKRERKAAKHKPTGR